MGIVRFGVSISLDGYMAGPNQSEKDPIGERGKELHQWAFPLRTFHRMFGNDGGETGPSDDIVAERLPKAGATIMGRNMFGPVRGAWDAPGNEPWNGWWGDTPPFHHPVFVLTHHARAPLPMQGGTTFHFVTEGIHAALEQARAVAGDKEIALGGGARTLRQFLAAGLVDRFTLDVVPLLLGAGERLFEETNGIQAGYAFERAVQTPAVTHYFFKRR